MALTKAETAFVKRVEDERLGMKSRAQNSANDLIRARVSLETFIGENQTEFDALYGTGEAGAALTAELKALTTSTDALDSKGLLSQSRVDIEKSLAENNNSGISPP